MTDREILDIANSERQRLLSLLPTVDPVVNTERYGHLIDCIERLNMMFNSAEFRIGGYINTDQIPVHPIDSVAPFPEPSTEEYTAPVMDTPEPEPEPEPEKTYAMTEVRAALAKARTKGANVTEVLSEFGVDNFSALPAAKYPDLMAKLEAL